MKLLDVVALTVDLPEHDLLKGQVGTLVEELSPETYEVEFCDVNGQAYASLAINQSQLMVLHHKKERAA